MRRATIALAAALAVLACGAPADAAKKKAPVKCHWVKATKKRKKHRVCVRMKAKKQAAPATKGGVTAPAAATPAPATPAPAAPAAPAPVVIAPPVVAPPLPPADDPAPPPAAARLQATAREFTLQLSRPTIAAGAVIVELVNRGEDPHDLHVRPAAGGADVLAVDRTDASGVAHAGATLPAGAYTLYCSLPGHEAAGMHATLTVQ
jgi:plastocyanin